MKRQSVFEQRNRILYVAKNQLLLQYAAFPQSPDVRTPARRHADTDGRTAGRRGRRLQSDGSIPPDGQHVHGADAYVPYADRM